jgi:GNAT superfamily N-acetyltransferase
MRLRDWEGPADTKAMQRLASRLWPRGPHAGGLGWTAATGQLPAAVKVAEDGGVAGWAGLADGELDLQADPARPEAALALLEWAVQTADTAELKVAVYDGDETVRSAVSQAGFSLDPDAKPVTGMFRDAGPEVPALPTGYRVRSVRAGELAARVEVHRAAWRPATLPWPGAVPAEVTPDATSRITAAIHEEVRRAWLYAESRDMVVEAPDGSLAGCCIVWWDPAVKCAEIEPLGVVPEHRRKGLAGAMCLAVAAKVASLGGERVFINVGPRSEYPAPAAAYLSAGFSVVSRGRMYQGQSVAGR